MKKNMKKIMALLLTVTLSLGLYGCGSKNDKTESGTSTAAESDTSAAATDGSEKKTLVIGDTTFNPKCSGRRNSEPRMSIRTILTPDGHVSAMESEKRW